MSKEKKVVSDLKKIITIQEKIIKQLEKEIKQVHNLWLEYGENTKTYSFGILNIKERQKIYTKS